MFNEITPNAIKKAFEKPGAVNLHLVDAQQARRILDRLVGYKISPLLWDKVRRGLSAGRVQTVALRADCRSRARNPRLSSSASTGPSTSVLNAKKPPVLTARFTKRNDEAIEIPDEADGASRSSSKSTARSISSSRSATREKKRNPVPPFITSTLQQEVVAQAAVQREAHDDAGAAPV